MTELGFKSPFDLHQMTMREKINNINFGEFYCNNNMQHASVRLSH